MVTAVHEMIVKGLFQDARRSRALAVFLCWAMLAGVSVHSETEPAASTHWAFEPLATGALPEVRDPGWCRTPVDRFILARLEREGLSPAPEASRGAWLRRLYWLLLGLPPGVDEIQAFQSDPQSDALQRWIDAALANPRYGERWAQHWLDLVRYSDTSGYERNLERPHAWPYRDYVIDASNADKPYPRFVREQLAGDSLGEDAATGFLVAGPFDDVKTVEEKFLKIQRQERLADMVTTVGTAFLGLSIGCARCHDHKTDPITHQDYYSFQALLAGVFHGERPNRKPAWMAIDQELGELESQRVEVSNQLVRFALPLDPPVQVTENVEAFSPVRLRGVRMEITATADGLEPAIDEIGLWTPGPGEPGEDTVFARRRIEVSEAVLQGMDLDVILSASDEARLWINGVPVATNRNWKRPTVVSGGDALVVGKNEFAIRAEGGRDPAGFQLVLLSGDVDDARTIVKTDTAWRVARAVSDGWQTNRFERKVWRSPLVLEAEGREWGQLEDLYEEEIAGRLETSGVEWLGSVEERRHNVALHSGGRVETSGTLRDNPLRHQEEHVIDGVFGDKRAWVSNRAGVGTVEIRLAEPQTIDRITWGRDREGLVEDRLPVGYKFDALLDDGRERRLVGSESRLDYRVHEDVRYRYRQGPLTDRERSELNEGLATLARLDKRIAGLRAIPRTVYAGRFEDPEPVHRLHRGDPEQPREIVAPDGLSLFGGFVASAPMTEQARRLRLAEWLFTNGRVLVSRVVANRVWQHLFGTGLVATPGDFGVNGSPPTHPELLDYLAGRLIEENWSIKALQRELVRSAVFRQGSRVDDLALRRDGGNRWLWRFPTRRLEAEAIRDGLLWVAGRLDSRMGGAPVSPFRPTKKIVRVYEPKETFGPEDWRRMIYGMKVRMEPDPVFGSFDVPDGGLICARRTRSATPLQSFGLMNSAYALDQVSALSQRIESEAGAQREAQVDHAYWVCLGRAPTTEEQIEAVRLVRDFGLRPFCRALVNANEFCFVP